jgi:hypothetical protein
VLLRLHHGKNYLIHSPHNPRVCFCDTLVVGKISQRLQRILRADDAANRLADSFIENGLKDENKVYSKEAAAKLVANHEAIVKDCTNEDPQSQKHIERASNVDAADALLRHVCNMLLSNDDTIHESVELLQMDYAKNAASAARVVASILCVPRDMSALEKEGELHCTRLRKELSTASKSPASSVLVSTFLSCDCASSVYVCSSIF